MKENNVMTEETSNLTKDTIWFWNEHAKPAIDWCSARWMDCYELSAGWTIGVSIVLGLWILGKILPDSDGESAPAPRRARAANSISTPAAAAPTSAAPAAKKVTWHYRLTLADEGLWRGAGLICPAGSVQARGYSEAYEMVQKKHSSALRAGMKGLRSGMVISEVQSGNHMQAFTFSENRQGRG